MQAQSTLAVCHESPTRVEELYDVITRTRAELERVYPGVDFQIELVPQQDGTALIAPRQLHEFLSECVQGFWMHKQTTDRDIEFVVASYATETHPDLVKYMRGGDISKDEMRELPKYSEVFAEFFPEEHARSMQYQKQLRQTMASRYGVKTRD